MEKIFISHRGKSEPLDEKWAEWLVQIVNENGYEAQYIEWENPGSILGWMNNALNNADRMLIVMTPRFRQSLYTMAEVWAFLAENLAEQNRILIIEVQETNNIPILLKGLPRLNLPKLDRDEREAAVVKYLRGNSPPTGKLPQPPDYDKIMPEIYKEDICNIQLASYFQRSESEQAISKAFSSRTRVAVHAAGGMGKSTLAKAYALSKQAEYDFVWLVNSETPDQVRNSFVDLANALGIPGTPAEKLHALKPRLTSKVLLLLDNLPNKEALKGVETGNSHLLITSRDPHWGGVAEKVMLEKWNDQDGAKFMQSLAKFDDSHLKAAEELSKALGGLPLGLHMAGCLIESSNEMPAVFILDLNKRLGAILVSGETGEYPNSIKAMNDYANDNNIILLTKKTIPQQKSAAYTFQTTNLKITHRKTKAQARLSPVKLAPKRDTIIYNLDLLVQLSQLPDEYNNFISGHDKKMLEEFKRKFPSNEPNETELRIFYTIFKKFEKRETGSWSDMMSEALRETIIEIKVYFDNFNLINQIKAEENAIHFSPEELQVKQKETLEVQAALEKEPVPSFVEKEVITGLNDMITSQEGKPTAVETVDAHVSGSNLVKETAQLGLDTAKEIGKAVGTEVKKNLIKDIVDYMSRIPSMIKSNGLEWAQNALIEFAKAKGWMS